MCLAEINIMKYKIHYYIVTFQMELHDVTLN